MKKTSFLLGIYLFVIVALFLYSYTQVDLSLTLSRASLYQTIEKSFQYIGYFNRPLSTYLYIGIVVLLFVFYITFLVLSSKQQITRKQFWIATIVMTVVLAFSYNAFSYDLFNYIFDAKIVTHYHLNPYQYRALDFSGDPMLSFMHWVERTYPYGPVWLGLTIPLSFIGLNIFLVTFFLFKMLMAGSFLGTTYYLEKILRKIDLQNVMFGVVLFAFNPLVIIESLVSAHHDIVQALFAVVAISLLVNNKSIRSIIMLLLSVGVKFATAFLAPLFLFVFFAKKMKISFRWDYVFIVISIIMIIPVILESFRTNFEPWYLLNFLPFVPLVGRRYFALIPTVIISFFSLGIYVPFLYTGNWDKPIPMILFWIMTVGVVMACLITILYKIKIAFFPQKHVK